VSSFGRNRLVFPEFWIAIAVLIGVLVIQRAVLRGLGHFHGVKVTLIGDVDWCLCPDSEDHPVVWP
jgi:hypothetical protein